jgi:hypothetical protein
VTRELLNRFSLNLKVKILLRVPVRVKIGAFQFLQKKIAVLGFLRTDLHKRLRAARAQVIPKKKRARKVVRGKSNTLFEPL